MSTTDTARAWILSAMQAHERGEWSRAAAGARIGTAVAALAQAEHLEAPGAVRPDLPGPSAPPARALRTVHEAFDPRHRITAPDPSSTETAPHDPHAPASAVGEVTPG